MDKQRMKTLIIDERMINHIIDALVYYQDGLCKEDFDEEENGYYHNPGIYDLFYHTLNTFCTYRDRTIIDCSSAIDNGGDDNG